MNPKPTREEVKQWLIDEIHNTIGVPRELIIETAGYTDLGFDSLDIIDLTIAAEDQFGIQVLDEEIDESVMQNIGQAIDIIMRHL